MVNALAILHCTTIEINLTRIMLRIVSIKDSTIRCKKILTTVSNLVNKIEYFEIC